MLSITEGIVSIIIALFVAGGPVVTWINARAKKKEEITTKQAEVEVISSAAEDAGIAHRWEEYANSIEDRLSERIKSLEDESQRNRRGKEMAVNYASLLRAHIYKQLAPPPPDWPEGLP